MNYLADTHILIWAIAIKHSLHKAEMPFSAQRFQQLCQLAGYLPIETRFEHAYLLETLTYAENAPRKHRDPFDRLLLSQAKAENMYFITHDELIPYYNEPCIVSV